MTRKKRTLLTVCILLALSLLLTALYVLNPIPKYADMVSSFQLDSEALVSEFIENAPKGYLGYNSYTSNFGLQGWAYRLLSHIHHGYFFYHTATAFLLAAATVLICWYLFKYDPVLSVVFFVVMGVSPWVLSMARNLYWVQFTWYLPMIVGLEYYFDVCKGRNWLYCLQMLVFVMVKSLCGYEFITCVLVSAMAFPFLKLMTSLPHKKDFKKQLRQVFILGASTVAGFAVAMFVHALARSPGDLSAGITALVNNSKIRMAWADSQYIAGSFANPEVANWLAYIAEVSLWEAIRTYFCFPTDIVFGIPGTLFPVFFCLAFAVSVAYTIFKRQFDKLILFFVFFVSSLSWIVLAKPHVMGHIHICYVIWYMGFVQIILYIPLRAVWDLISHLCHKISNAQTAAPRL